MELLGKGINTGIEIINRYPIYTVFIGYGYQLVLFSLLILLIINILISILEV